MIVVPCAGRGRGLQWGRAGNLVFLCRGMFPGVLLRHRRTAPAGQLFPDRAAFGEEGAGLPREYP